MPPLTAKQQRFVEEYLVDLNATQAAIRAGYSAKTASEAGFENLRKPQIAQAIQAAMQSRSLRTEITQDRVLREIARLAFFDIRRLVDAQGRLKPLRDLDDDTAAAIAGVEVVRTGQGDKGASEVLKFKIADKNSALEKLSKHLQIYSDKMELTGPGGIPLQLTVRFEGASKG